MAKLNNIRHYRIKKLLSQKELAQKIGVSQAMISLWENGVNSPTVGVAWELCKVLGASLEEVFKLEK